MVQGDEQVGRAGAPLGDPLIVRVTDLDGTPLAGQPVSWTVNGGGGAVDPVSASSNAEGLAFAQWILGPDPGLNVVEARVAADTVLFSATARGDGGGGGRGGAARIVAVQGDGQTAETGTPVTVAPAVRVTDSADNPAPGVAVNFVVTMGGGTVVGASQTTGTDGVARVGRWTLGDEPGENVLEARAGSLQGSPVVFTAQATGSGPPGESARLPVPPPEHRSSTSPSPSRSRWWTPMARWCRSMGFSSTWVSSRRARRARTTSWSTGAGSRVRWLVIATFEMSITRKGKYRLRALTDDLPELGPHGPEPWLYSYVFEVK